MIVGWATGNSARPYRRSLGKSDVLSISMERQVVADQPMDDASELKTELVRAVEVTTADGCTAYLGALEKGEKPPELTVCDFGDWEPLTSGPPVNERPPDHPLGFLSRVALDADTRITAARAFLPLSAPTHAPCWIDPVALVERAARLDTAPDTADLVLALLRLAPEGRGDALAEMPRAPRAEWREAIRHALGAPDAEFGEDRPVWIAAARSRSPCRDDEAVARRFPHRGPDGALAARYRFAIVPASPDHDGEHLLATPREQQCRPDGFRLRDAALPGHDFMLFVTDEEGDEERDEHCPLQPTRQLQLGYHDPEMGKFRYWVNSLDGSVAGIRHVATLWPLARDSFRAQGLVNLLGNLECAEVRHGHRCYLEPLIDPATPLREAGTLLLVTGLAAADAAEHGLAVERDRAVALLHRVASHAAAVVRLERERVHVRRDHPFERFRVRRRRGPPTGRRTASPKPRSAAR